jgi:hypothetical protein
MAALRRSLMSDGKMIDARDATRELADLKRRIKSTRIALQSVRRTPRAENDQS